MKLKTPLLISFMTLMSIVLIGKIYHSPQMSYSQSACIPAKESFAYEVAYNLPLYPEKPVFPGSPWVVEAGVPYLNPEVLYTMTLQGGEDIIWVKTGSYEERHYYLYNIKSKIWQEVSYEKEGFNGNVDIFELITDKDGSVWAFNGASNGENVPVFIKYNARNISLSFDQNSIGLPAGTQSEIDILLDSSNVFWILRSDDSIYSYDIETQKIEKKVSLENQDISDAALGLDGNIYFLDQSTLIQISDEPANMYRRGALYMYSRQKNETSLVSYLLEPTPFPLNLLVDNSGDIWFDGLGWMDSGGKWYQVNKSPLFVTTKLDGAGGQIYRWQTPRISFESSDGRLWFRSPNGMTFLDPSKHEWCWFTTYNSNIVEDSEHNLWMIADGKLYKNPLSK